LPPKTGRPGRPRKPFKRWPRGAAYATVNKTYARGTVVATERKLVHGTPGDLARALAASSASHQINTAFIERHNGTDRNHNARKARKTYEFSKDLVLHVAVSWWVLFCYNFHHLHRSLRQKLSDGSIGQRTPAMAIGLSLRPLTIADILSTPVVGFMPSSSPPPAAFGLRHAAGPAP